MAATPTLIVVSGASGFGKTTLAHRLATEIPCIAICRDEIKEGLVHASPGYKATPGDLLTPRVAKSCTGVHLSFNSSLRARHLDSLRSRA